jgi:hypothetical protein
MMGLLRLKPSNPANDLKTVHLGHLGVGDDYVGIPAGLAV